MARDSKRKRDEKRFGKPERLADRIGCVGSVPLGAIRNDDIAMSSFRPNHAAAMRFYSEATIVQAQNVFDWYRANCRGEKLSLFKDIPCWRPPFRSVFIEFSGDAMLTRVRFGFLFVDSEHKDDGSSLVTIFSFMEFGDKQICGPLTHTCAEIDRMGRLTDVPVTYVIGGNRLPELSIPDHDGTPTGAEGVVWRCCQEATVIAATAVAFMHCKNVALDAVEPDGCLNRERRKAGLKPFLRYHTINIEPIKKVLKTEGNIETDGLKKALHICRGHFATYTEDRPLFGHTVGTVWKPAHVRGSVKQGVVVSDYNVNAPQLTQQESRS